MTESKRSVGNLDAIRRLTGQDTGFAFRNLLVWADREEIASYCASTRNASVPVAKRFDAASNTVWVIRNFLCAKYLLAATILSASAEYSKDKGIVISLPYLWYYSLFNCCRAFLMTVPDVEWNDAAILTMGHQRIINNAENHLRRLSPKFSEQWSKLLKTSRFERELFSYKFPGRGPGLFRRGTVDDDDVLAFCRILADLCQINSECLLSALAKHYRGSYEIDASVDLGMVYSYVVDEGRGILFDEEDYYRIERYLHKRQYPAPISVVMTEGMEEDFLGAWRSEYVEDGFDPDRYFGHIFDMY